MLADEKIAAVEKATEESAVKLEEVQKEAGSAGEAASAAAAGSAEETETRLKAAEGEIETLQTASKAATEELATLTTVQKEMDDRVAGGSSGLLPKDLGERLEKLEKAELLEKMEKLEQGDFEGKLGVVEKDCKELKERVDVLAAKQTEQASEPAPE